MDLVDEIYRLTRGFPDEERYGLSSQMRRAAVSIPSNLAAGYGRNTRKEYRRHAGIANGSLRELETQLIIAGRQAFCSRESADPAWNLIQSIGKMLRALMSALADAPQS